MKITRSSLKRTFSFSWRDLLVSAAILLCATGACALLHQTADTIDGFASPVYVLAVLLISRFTSGYLFGLIAAVLGVIGVNYVFTYPYMAFNFTISGYPLTMFTFLVVSLVTSTLTTKTKEQDRLRMENEKVKMRADLLRSVSHDIRTPLTSIMGATSAILENPALSPAEQQSLLVDVRDDAQWLIRVVENLLSITRIGGCGGSPGRGGPQIPKTVSRRVRGGPRAGRAAPGPHGRHPHHAGPVQSDGERRVPRRNHHAHRPVRAAGWPLGPLLRAGQRPGHSPPETAHPVQRCASL